jgi:hypothetical protein
MEPVVPVDIEVMEVVAEVVAAVCLGLTALVKPMLY